MQSDANKQEHNYMESSPQNPEDRCIHLLQCLIVFFFVETMLTMPVCLSVLFVLSSLFPFFFALLLFLFHNFDNSTLGSNVQGVLNITPQFYRSFFLSFFLFFSLSFFLSFSLRSALDDFVSLFSYPRRHCLIILLVSSFIQSSIHSLYTQSHTHTHTHIHTPSQLLPISILAFPKRTLNFFLCCAPRQRLWSFGTTFTIASVKPFFHNSILSSRCQIFKCKIARGG